MTMTSRIWFHRYLAPWLFVLGLMCLPLTSSADITTTWHFTNASQYSVSAPQYIRVDPSSNGYAELILQALTVYQTTHAEWTNGIPSLVNFGPDQSVRLSGTPSTYSAAGLFTSRIFNGGNGVRWDTLQYTGGNNDYISDPNVKAYYRMDNDGWLDAVSGGYGVPGAGPTFSPIARAGTHSGSFRGLPYKDYVTLQNPGLNNGKACTIAFWVNLRRWTTYGGLLVSRDSSTRASGFMQANSGGSIIFHVNGGTSQAQLWLGGMIATNAWRFLVGTWDGNGDKLLRVYTNGAFAADSSLTAEPYRTCTTMQYSKPFQFGRDDLVDDPNRFSDGLIDEAIILDKALSSDEVARLYRRYAYVIKMPLSFQVRSGSAPADVLTKSFVGPNGTSDTFYSVPRESLASCDDFSVSNQYAQYRAYLFSSRDNGLSPYLEAAAFVDQNCKTYFDNVLFDLQRGQYTSNTTHIPEDKDAPYLGLAVKNNGGYPTNGVYQSRILDAGSSVNWGVISWDSGLELDANIPGLIGLWHLNDTSWAPAKGILFGAGNATVTPLAKLGSGSAVFNGINQHVSFPVSASIRTVEFWLNSERADDAVMEITYSTTNTLYVSLSNRTVTVSGPAPAPAVTVNGDSVLPKLLSGWNHVAITFQAPLLVDEIDAGIAGLDYLKGKMDELAVYSRELSHAEMKAHYVSGRRNVAGRVRAQAWAADATNPPGTFGAVVLNGQNLGLSGRFLQYKLLLEGESDATPAVNSITVNHNVGSFLDDTRGEIVQGSFELNQTGWYGDEIKLDELGSLGPINLGLALDSYAQAVYHFDDVNLTAPQSIKDSKRGGSGDGTGSGDVTASSGSMVGTGCGVFGGVNGFAALVGGFDLPGDFTISAWFNTSSGNREALISSDDGSQYYTIEVNGNGTALDPGKVTFVVSDGAVARERYVTSIRTGLNDGRWHHVAGCRKGRFIHIYIDGTRTGTTIIESSYGGMGTGTPFVGKRGTRVPADYYQGLVDEVAIWSRALSEGEIGQYAGRAFRTQGVGEYTSQVITNLAGPAIWQTLFWMPDAPYNKPLSVLDTTIGSMWHFDEASGATANNAVAAKPNASVSGGSFVAGGRFGNCLSLAGAGNATATHDDDMATSELSVEAWVSMNEIDTRVVVDKSTAAGGYILGTDAAGRPYFQARNGGAWVRVTAALPIRAGQWTHLAGTYDGTLKLFVDGEIAASLTQGGLVTYSGASLVIGSGYSGFIDEVAIHKRALTSGELFDHYRAGAMTLKIQVRASNDSTFTGVPFAGPGKLASTYFTEFASDDMMGDVNLAQYFQYKVYFGTENSALSPRLSGVKIFVSSYPISNPSVEPIESQAFAFPGNLLGFAHVVTSYTNTEVQYQISGDAGGSPRWFYWNGVQWAQRLGADIYGANTSTRTNINSNIGSFYDQLYPKVGGTFRFKALLHSDGDQPMRVDSVSLVSSEGRIVVTVPNGIENGDAAWAAGVPYTLNWTWVGNVSANVAVDFSNAGTNGPWTPITNSIPRGAGGNGSVTWRTPEYALETNCFVRVRDLSDVTIRDVSDSAFTIIRRFRVLAPNGGETWYAGKTTNIVWEAPYNVGPVVEIDYAHDGVNYDMSYRINALADNTSGSKSNTYVWAVPAFGYLSTNARIRVQTSGAGQYTDQSDGTFVLAGVEIIQPIGGRKVKRNDPFTIQWNAMGAGAAVQIDLSSDGGATYSNIYASVANVHGTNSFVWNVTQPGTDRAVLRIRSLSDPNVEGYSAEFTLADIDVTAPDGGEIWMMDTTKTITWTSGGAGPTVSLDFSTNSGVSWMPIDTWVTNSGSYVWTVSRLVSKLARVRVVSDGSGAQSDTNLWSMSAADFNIAGIRVRYPDRASDTIQRGVPTIMLHDGAPESWAPGGVRLEISYDEMNTYSLLGVGADNYTMGAPYVFTPTTPTTKARVRASVNDASPYTNVFDISDQYFTVAGLQVQAPTNTAVLNIGAAFLVRWLSAGAADQAYVYYSNQGTNNFVNLTPAGIANSQVYPGQNSFNWNIAPTLRPSTNARLRVSSGAYNDISMPFTLRGIRINSPNTSSVWTAWTPQAISWENAGIDLSARVRLSLSTDGGVSFPYEITNNYPLSTGVFPWNNHPAYDPTRVGIIRMEIVSSASPADTNVVANSDVFTLRGIRVKSPLPGEAWQLGSTNSVVFVAAAAGAQATISYSANGGSSYEALPIVSALPISDGTNTYSWTVELGRQPATNAVLRIAGTIYTGYSPRFTIGGVRVVRPFQYDIWAVGETNVITWISVGTTGTNLIELLYDGYPPYTITNDYVGSTLNWYVLSNAIPGGLDTISNVILRVRDAGGYEGLSEPFKLVSEPRIEMVSPLGGDFWKVGQTRSIQWVKGGQMSADQFRIFFSRDNFVTVHGEVLGTVVFSPSNNIFSIDWDVPDQLGTTRILVTNTFNSLVYAFTDPFDVCGNFRMIYPNGDPGEAELYALNTANVSWGTRGSVAEVDLYYTYGTQPWTKINTLPIVNNGAGISEQNTAASWLIPNLQSQTVRFRVQDHSYTNIFNGVTPGPYDDADNLFEVKYYTIYWDIYYVDSFGITGRLDKLSVNDSSGWAQSGLSCSDAGGMPQLIMHKYPFGVYDTAWYREFFHDKVDFQWLCDTNQTRHLELKQAEVEPEYHVLANFAYDISNRTFTIHSWLERNGAILTDPASSTITVFKEDGAQIESLTTNACDLNGVFWQWWDVNATEIRRSETYLTTDIFFAKVEIDYSGVKYSAGLTFALRLPAGEETVQAIEAIVNRAETNILMGVNAVAATLSGVSSNLSGVSSNLDAFRGESRTGFSNLTSIGRSTTNMLMTLSGEVQDITNTLLPGINFMTNEITILGPSISNLNMSVTNLSADLVSDRARILTRPTSVLYGSTNTFLYKTRPGYGPGTPEIHVRNDLGVEIQVGVMSEIVPGIYQRDMIANWGPGNVVMMCDDPMASDSMVLLVTASSLDSVPGMVTTMDGKLDLLQTQLDGVETLVQGIQGADLSGIMAELDTIGQAVQGIQGTDMTGVMDGLNTIETAVRGIGGTDLSAIDLSGVGRIENQLGKLTDTSSSQTFFGRLSSITDQLKVVEGVSADASKKAQTAKTQAGSAASGVQSLKTEIEQGDLAGALSRLEQIKQALAAANANVSEIPKLVKLASLVDAINLMAAQVAELAEGSGFENPLQGFEEDLGGGGLDDDAIGKLNGNLEEVRSSMKFMQDLMDETRYQPIIQEELRAAE